MKQYFGEEVSYNDGVLMQQGWKCSSLEWAVRGWEK